MALKTSKCVAKRFKLTKKGKITYHCAGKSHLLSKKESDRKRSLRKARQVESKKQRRMIKRMLPYG